ncbi:MAG TPA: carbon starvation protein A [Candidatus Polarisedimenticolia bacterium]|nr:carbon starvation protein A [Candidatus Polarisedimenticolia bacterium]
MNTLPILIVTICLFAIAYRYYSAFIASKVLVLDDSRPTPAHRLNDGQNYFPTHRWVLFGHHFAAITGAGPLIGPVLAAQFGFLPGLLWLVIGVVLGGAVHDFVILASSVRRNGRSLAEIARTEIGPVAGVTCAVAILFVIVIALAGLGLAVVNALKDSAWGVFTIAATIPIALYMGIHMYRLRKGRIAEATAIGVALLLGAVIAGRYVPGSPMASWFTLSEHQITLAIAAYGFTASVLPVWLLLCPRDYLSSFMKIGTILALALGVFLVHPDLRMPALTQFAAGGGPIIPGKLYPFVFITIACGAISGFHALVGSGTTPKMIDRESDARVIGYGAMLMESFVGVMAFIAAASLYPGDYFAINVPPEKFATLGMSTVHLPEFSRQVGESLAGRTGGAVSLAIGMAQIFAAVPGLKGLLSYWYHFAIMFEALFILTTIDTGTRVGRFLVQEFLGRIYAPLARTEWMPGTILSSLLVVAGWGYFIWTGSISTIWPMFGVANQLLASIALCVGTTVLINAGRARYAWVTLLPLSFVATTTLTAGWKNIWDNFLPLARSGGRPLQGYLNAGMTAVMMACVFIILADSLRRWGKALAERRASPSAAR